VKSRLVDVITNNEDSVRMRIFAGEFPVDEATAELLRIERAQHDTTRRHLREAQAIIDELRAKVLNNAR
jgi:hypothetical protein